MSADQERIAEIAVIAVIAVIARDRRNRKGKTLTADEPRIGADQKGNRKRFTTDGRIGNCQECQNLEKIAESEKTSCAPSLCGDKTLLHPFAGIKQGSRIIGGPVTAGSAVAHGWAVGPGPGF